MRLVQEPAANLGAATPGRQLALPALLGGRMTTMLEAQENLTIQRYIRGHRLPCLHRFTNVRLKPRRSKTGRMFYDLQCRICGLDAVHRHRDKVRAEHELRIGDHMATLRRARA